MCQNLLPSGGCRSLGAKISGEGVVPGEYFFSFYKTRHILLSDSANCTVLLRAVVLTQYRRVTDGRTADRQAELPKLVQRLQCEYCGARIAAHCKN